MRAVTAQPSPLEQQFKTSSKYKLQLGTLKSDPKGSSILLFLKDLIIKIIEEEHKRFPLESTGGTEGGREREEGKRGRK